MNPEGNIELELQGYLMKSMHMMKGERKTERKKLEESEREITFIVSSLKRQ